MNPIHERIRQLRTRDPRIAATLGPDNATVATLRGKLTDPVSGDELKRAPFDAARKFVAANRPLFAGIDDRDLANARSITSRHGTTSVLFQQKYGDATVIGGNLAVLFDNERAVSLVKSSLAAPIDAPKTARIARERAEAAAVKHAGGGTIFEKTPPELVVVDAKKLHQPKSRLQKYYLCWRMIVLAPEGKPGNDWVYFVDATNGDVLFRHPADQTGTGTGFYSHGTDVVSEPSGAMFRLRDTVTSAGWGVPVAPVIHDYDDHGAVMTTLHNYSTDGDDAWDAAATPARVDNQSPEVDLNRFVPHIADYFYDTFGWVGWNDAGLDAEAHAHNEKHPNNAFWSGSAQEIFFADGDNLSYRFMTPLDVVAHEYAHGVKYYMNVVQFYDGESGALNEATSDMFGAFVAMLHPIDDPEPWNHGGQACIPPIHGRRLDDPARDDAAVVMYDTTSETTKFNSCVAGYYPDHYSIRYMGAGDYHGVHCNAPIISHALYLMINGGTNRISGMTVTGIGAAPIEQMLFEVLSTGLVTNTSDFADFRLAMIEECRLLYPENLAYLATVKAGFQAVGIGPDLYVRDRLVDAGEEPGVVSCMSPDIIVRQTAADAATLAQIADFDNASLGQDMQLGPSDQYVYFRLQNRGASPASGTFRLFLSPVATFPTPATWTEVGHFDFPNIAAAGGTWAPSAADECITIPAALINALGVGHYCFIGIVESELDPPPDRMLISDLGEFHDFIAGSNNYAWRNCNIENVAPNAIGEMPAITKAFRMTGFEPLLAPKELEIDARDLPEGTQLAILLPSAKLTGAKAFETPLMTRNAAFVKSAGALEELKDAAPVRPVALSALGGADLDELLRAETHTARRETHRPLRVTPGKILRIKDIMLGRGETLPVHFTVKFPANVGRRDVSLAFRERRNDQALGQMNYIFRIRDAR